MSESNATTAKIEKFWRHVFGGQRGLLMVWAGVRDEGGKIPKESIRSNVFNFPKAAKTAASWALEKAGEGRDVYFCTHLLTAAKRNKENAGEVGALWGDLDGAGVPNGNLKPSAVVESSPGRFHCYWRLSDAIPPETAEQLNRRIARKIGADPSGFDLTQLLRVPGTPNYKHEGDPLVEIRELDGSRTYTPAELEKILPILDQPNHEGKRPDNAEDEPPVVLGTKALKAWRGEAPKRKDNGEVDRSASLTNIGRVLYDAGASRATVIASLRERDEALGWRKYVDRRDADKRYHDILDELEANGRNGKPAIRKGGAPFSGYAVDAVDAVDANTKELPTTVAFPTNALPRQAGRLVEETAAAIYCPPEFVAVPLLVALGSAIGNARRVRLKQGWTEGAALYAAVVADPGEKKTPAAKVAVEAAVRAQAKMRNEYREKKDEYARELREYEVDKASARKDGMAAPPPPEEPIMRRALVEDTTTEALAAVLEGNPRGVLVTRDELAAWVKGMDQYRAAGKGADRQFWLSAWSNSYVSVDRKGRDEPLVLPLPFVGVFGSIQPSVLPDLGAGREDGLLDRFLFSYPETTPSRWSDDEISDGAIGGVKWLYDKLRHLKSADDEDGDLEPALVALSPDAKLVLVQLMNAHRAEMDAPGFPARLRGPWAKLEAYLARLALIVALCRSVANDAPERIEAEDLLRASVLLNYFKDHARRVYVGLYGGGRVDSLAADVARFLEERGGSWSGQPTELFETLDSKHKPERAKDLSADLAETARRSPLLSFDRDKREVFTKEDGTRTNRRVWELSLENSVNSVNSVNSGEQWSNADGLG